MSSIDVIAPVRGLDGKVRWQRLPAGSSAPRGAQYRARFRTPQGHSRTKTFARRVDAERFLATTEHTKGVGEFVDPMAGRVRFSIYADAWLERKRQTCKATTVQAFTAHVRKHLAPRFGDCELKAITREQVKAFAGSLQPGVAPTTARAIVFTLAAILREAVDDGRLIRNPAERIQVGAKTERRVDPMHVARISTQVPAIADAMPGRWRAAVLLMASTGLRLGECLGLTVDRIDFLRRTVRVDRQLANVAGGSGFGTTKTRAGVRLIPVPPAVTDMLAAHLAAFGAGTDGLVFSMSRGQPVGRSQWSSAYRDACAVADVDGRTRTHDLRHVAASSLIASGLSVAAVQAVLGHSSPAETLTCYTHFWPSDEDRTREAIERASMGWLSSAVV